MFDTSRFWSKVRRTRGCWIWTAGRFKSGYGCIKIDKKTRRAHRVAYELEVGRIPKRKLIRHTCDNRLCVRPDHLKPGTHKDNNDDMWSRSRDNRTGEEQKHRRKISDEDLITIHSDLKSGRSRNSIAKKFGVSATLIKEIKHGRRAYGRRLKSALKQAA